APALRALGDVVEVGDEQQAELVREQQAERGVDSVLLSFGSPKQAPTSLRCAVVPVFSWAFPTLPTGGHDNDPGSDWRNVRRGTGRAIPFPGLAARAVKAAMGSDYPVIAVAPPTADRLSQVPPPPAAATREIAVRAVVFDSREQTFDPGATTIPSPIWRPS